MEGIYQNNLYSSQQLPYVLPPSHPEHSYSHYGSQQQPNYRSSAFSDARSSPPSTNTTATPYHSAGLNNASSSHVGDMNNHHHHQQHHHHHHDTNNTHTNSNPNDHYNNNTSHHNTTTTGWTSSSPNLSWNSSPPPLPPPSRNNSYGGYNTNSNTLPHMSTPMQRPKLTTTVWEDEGTLCYQVDAKSVCVARRQDNDMINGTKLLNVVGMSRGKRDGILKNEKGRVVVKVGAMHLKGVWITFSRAKDLATKFKIVDILYPLFVEDPSVFLSVPPPAGSGLPIMLPSSTSNSNNNRGGGYYKNDNSFGSFNMQSWGKQSYQSLPSITNQQQQQQDQMIIRSQQQQNSGSCSPVPGNIAPILSNEESDMYLLNNPYSRYHNSTTASTANHHSYNLYPSDNNNTHTSITDHHFSSSPYENHTSPYLHSTTSTVGRNNKPAINDKEDNNEDKSSRSIDFPSSPPPESSTTNSHGMKYASSPYQLNNSSPPSWSTESNNNDSSSAKRKSPLGSSSLRTAGLVMVHGRHPLSSEIEEKSFNSNKGRKRGHQQEKSTSSTTMIQQQRKRMKNNEKGGLSP